jgi:hypothetical protein
MEMFPKSDELISITAFGKYILNPMNEVTISSSSNDISYIQEITVMWLVLSEIQKTTFLISILTMLKTFCRINASYLYSNQELNAEKVK